MRILYLCHRIPYPPDKGDKIRAFHQLRALGARHEVDLFTLADDPADLRGQPALRELCRSVTVAPLHPGWARLRSLPYLLTQTPLTIPYFDSPELRAEVRKALAQRSYDRIFVYCSAMAQYVEAGPGIPMVTDLVDVDSNKWEQYAKFARLPFSAVYRKEGASLRRYERDVCEKSAGVVVTTEREARLVREISPSAHVHVIANGVDTEFFKRDDTGTETSSPTIGFTGDMSYFPNQQAVTYFARRVFPSIRQSLPDARFLIVGRNPSRAIRNLCQMAGVEVTGFVPDVRTHLARMHVAVAPFSIAAGIQNKILEAMSYELPIVATARTAQGLTPGTAASVDIADTAEAMAVKIIRLLRNPELAREKGRAGRHLVAAEYNWELSLFHLLKLIEKPARTDGHRPTRLMNGW